MMSKEQFSGTGKVFSFTLIQLLKSRANIISLIIILLFTIISIPAFTYFTGSNEPAGEELKTFYFENQTDISFENVKTLTSEDESLKDLEIKEGSIPEEEKEAAGAVLSIENGGLMLAFLMNQNLTPEANEKQQALMGAVYDWVEKEKLKKAGFSQESLQFLVKEKVREVLNYDQIGKETEVPDESQEEEGGFDQTDYNSRMGYSILLMTLCMYASGFIVRSVIEEKASKLVDLLLVSVKPAALLLGKVLAVLIYVVIYMAVMALGVFISTKVSNLIFGASSSSAISSLFASLHFDTKGLVVVLITSILGYLFFGLLAGLCGAGCSNMAESGGALSTCMILIMAGYMVSIFTSIGANQASKTLSVLPILSVFMAPMNFMKGQIGFGAVLLSWGLQLIAILLLIFLSARVYSRLIIYNGKRLSFFDIIKMAKKEGAEDEKAA